MYWKIKQCTETSEYLSDSKHGWMEVYNKKFTFHLTIVDKMYHKVIVQKR